MKMLITQNQLELLKCRDKVPCECESCKNIFYVGKNLALRGLKGTKAVKFCSNECKRKRKGKTEIECNCLQCNNKFKYLKSSRPRKFCSHLCSNKYYGDSRRKYPETKNCLNCNKSINGWKVRFCSKSCNHKFVNDKLEKEWLKGDLTNSITESGLIPCFIEKYIWKKYNNKCADCEWSKVNPINNKSPLHIHHIDGNSQNNKENNLKLLCPNCHSLTPNFGRFNKNGTRGKRRLFDL